ARGRLLRGPRPHPAPASGVRGHRRSHRSGGARALRAALRRERIAPCAAHPRRRNREARGCAAHGAIRTLGVGIAKLVTHTDPRDQLVALARYSSQREQSNVVGVHIYSFGGAVPTASWMRKLM